MNRSYEINDIFADPLGSVEKGEVSEQIRMLSDPFILDYLARQMRASFLRVYINSLVGLPKILLSLTVYVI